MCLHEIEISNGRQTEQYGWREKHLRRILTIHQEPVDNTLRGIQRSNEAAKDSDQLENKGSIGAYNPA